ncbi:hypothetical protein LOD99_12110 [Oopsacas minuta]|uniref:Uncharacterized protein n=1 Tax=Oopsacas minuta TaxID=111878 RepID=A0AAV7JHH3_9METZ|nr:hypothetical protein LOD99_12110 [Oopsacas minuta]
MSSYIIDLLEIGAFKYTQLKKLLKQDIIFPLYRVISQYRQEISLLRSVLFVTNPEGHSIGVSVPYFEIFELTIQRHLLSFDSIVNNSQYPLSVRIADGLDGSGSHNSYNQVNSNLGLDTHSIILFGFKVLSMTDSTGILEKDLEIQICEVENGDVNSNNPETIVSPGDDNPDAESNHLPPSMAESSLDNERTHLLPMAESSLDNERTHLLPMAESSLENKSTHIFTCTTTPLGNDSTEKILSDLIRGKDPELHRTNVSNSLLSDFRGNYTHPARLARIEACKGIQKQAKKIIARSTRTLRPLRIGDIVAVPVSQFDRSKGNPPNIIGIVLEFDQRGYQIGTRTAKIRDRLARNQVEFIKFTGLNSEHIPDEELSIREIVRAQSISGGQGFRRCHCKSNCLTKRCSY